MSKILTLLAPFIKPLLIFVVAVVAVMYVHNLDKKVAQFEVASESWEKRLKTLDNALAEQSKAMADIQAAASQLSARLHKLQLPKLVEKDPQHATVAANSLFSDTQCLLERASGAKRDCPSPGDKANKPGKR